MDAVGAQPGKVTRSIPRNLVAGVGKAVAVEIGGRSRILPTQGGGVHAGSGLKLGAHNLGTLGAVRQTGVGHAEGQRLSRLLGDDCRERPASHNGIECSVHISANPLLASNGQIHDHGER